MSKHIIDPGGKWIAKKDIFIGNRSIRKGDVVTIHAVSAYVEDAYVTVIINTYLETIEANKFRTIFKKMH